MLLGVVYCLPPSWMSSLCFLLAMIVITLPKAMDWSLWKCESQETFSSLSCWVSNNGTDNCKKIQQPKHDLTSICLWLCIPHNSMKMPCLTPPPHLTFHLRCDASLKYSPGLWLSHTCSCSRLYHVWRSCSSPLVTPVLSLPAALCSWADVRSLCYHVPLYNALQQEAPALIHPTGPQLFKVSCIYYLN